MAHIRGILPSGKTINPTKPETGFYFDKQLVGYVIKKVTDPWARQANKNPYRIVTGWSQDGTVGDGPNWQIGAVNELDHDQTMRSLGSFEVVGQVSFLTGEKVGDVPNKTIPHWVFK